MSLPPLDFRRPLCSPGSPFEEELLLRAGWMAAAGCGPAGATGEGSLPQWVQTRWSRSPKGDWKSEPQRPQWNHPDSIFDTGGG